MAASISVVEEELMVVTVDGDGDLRCHPEVLESLLSKIRRQSKYQEIPVVIIGVIGEPNTNKACFVNLIRYYIDSFTSNNQCSKDLEWILQVWNDVNEKKRVEYGNIKYGLSIGSSKPRLINTKDACEVAVLVLDIWYSGDELSNGINTVVYNKLIDLCLCLSSVVVYTGFGTSSTSPKTIKDYLWTPSESEVFKNLNSESFQRLFIVLQEWSCYHLVGFGKDKRGPKSFLESKTQPFKPLLKIKNLSTELKSKFKKTVCYLLPSEKKDQIVFPRFISQLIQNILFNADYKLTPVFRQGQIVTVKSLETLFFNGVSIANKPCILTEDFSEENTKSSSYRDKLRRRPMETEDMDEEKEARDVPQKKRSKHEPNNKSAEKQQENGEKQQQNSKQKSNNQHQQKSKNPQQQQRKELTSDVSITVDEPTVALTKSSVTEPTLALAKSSVKEQELNLKSVLENYEKEAKEKFHGGLSFDKLYFEEGELKKFHVESLEKIENEARENFNRFLMQLKSTTYEIYTKISTENSALQKKYEKLKKGSDEKIQGILGGLQDWMKKIILGITPQEIYHKAEDFINQESNKFVQNLEHPWNTHFHNLFQSHKNEILIVVNSLFFGIKSYEEKMIKILSENIYLTQDDFEKAHAHSFQEAVVENPGEELFKDSMNKAILNIKCKLIKENSVIAELEEKMTKDAIDLVIREYHKFMKSQITPNRILTDKQIQQLHTKAADILINSFLPNSEFNITPAWKIGQNELNKILNDGSLLNQYLEENKENIENLKLKRTKVMEEAERTYKQSMNYFLQTAKLTESRMNFFHEKSMKKGFQLYVDQMGRDGSINWDRWGNILRNKMNNAAQSSLEENEIKLPLSESSDSQKEVMMEEIQNQNFGVGIYIGPNIVMSSVIKAEDKLSEFSTRQETLQLSPFIAFMNEKICYGEEAEELFKVQKSDSNYLCINIYEILTPNDTTNLYTTVEIYGETFQLRPEEVLALFLHHLKLELENKCVLDSSSINSCVVALSAFVPGAAKKILKNALFLAGFHNSTLIHTTTAMGISYQLTEKPKLWYRDEYRILVVHEGPGIFDIACIVVSESAGVKVKSIFGLPDIPNDHKDSHGLSWLKNFLHRDPTPEEIHEKNIKNLIRETLKNCYTYNLSQIIMIDGSEVHRKVVEEGVYRVPKQIDKNRGILVGASVLSLISNSKNKSVLGIKKSLEYEDTIPFQVSLEDSDGKIEIILKKNTSVISRNLNYNFDLLRGMNSSYCVRLTERSAKSSGDTEIVNCVNEVEIPPMETTNHLNNHIKGTLNVSMSTEGILDMLPYLDLSTPGDVPIFTRHVFMDEDELRKSMETLPGIFPRNKKIEQKNEKKVKMVMAMEKLQLPSFSKSLLVSNSTSIQPLVSSPSTQKKSKASEDKSTQNTNAKLEEAREKLTSLVQKVNEKLEAIDQTKPLIQKIQQLLEQSKKMVKNDKATLTMLEVQYQILEKGAATTREPYHPSSSKSLLSSNSTSIQPRVSSPSTQKKSKASEDKSTQNDNSKLDEIQGKMNNLKEKLFEKLDKVKADEKSLTALEDLLQKLEKEVS